jgi:hypothetical protein
MWLFNQPSSAARTALVYITVGTLMVIWTGVWFLYLRNDPPVANGVYYVCGGLLVTGLALIGIGFGLGQIGRSARHADLPPQEVAQAVVNMQPAAVAAGPALAATPAVPAVPVAPPPNSTTAVVAPVGPAVFPPAQVKQASKARMA